MCPVIVAGSGQVEWCQFPLRPSGLAHCFASAGSPARPCPAPPAVYTPRAGGRAGRLQGNVFLPSPPIRIIVTTFTLQGTLVVCSDRGKTEDDRSETKNKGPSRRPQPGPAESRLWLKSTGLPRKMRPVSSKTPRQFSETGCIRCGRVFDQPFGAQPSGAARPLNGWPAFVGFGVNMME